MTDHRGDLEAAIKVAESEIARLQRRVEEWKLSLPPFEVGQRVRPKDGNRSGVGRVMGVDRLERTKDWVVFVSFGSTTKVYTYIASALESAEVR